MSSAKEVGARKKQDSSDWYSFSKYLIDPLMVNRIKCWIYLDKETTRLHELKICVKILKAIWKMVFFWIKQPELPI